MTPATRHKSRHRGIWYRIDARGNRRWIVWYRDSEGIERTVTLPEGCTEKDALSKQAELRGKISRGERVVPSKMLFEEFAREWLASQTRLRPKTIEAYEWGLEHLFRRLRRVRVNEIDVDLVARLVASLEADGLSGASVRNVITPLSRVMSHAVRRGMISSNPVRGLEKHERPKSSERKLRILNSQEISTVVDRTPKKYRPLIATAIFTGMRMGELLELRWSEVHFHGGNVRVLSGKTNAAARDVVLMPGLAKLLREHRLQSKFSKDTDLVFPTSAGEQMSPSNVRRRGLAVALGDELEHCRFHDLRHTFASILIGQGLDVTFVADQLGHTNPAVTLKVYAKLFDPKRRRDEAREKLEAAFGGMV